nr:hypothetical protein [Paraburkholderia sp. BCC1885]
MRIVQDRQIDEETAVAITMPDSMRGSERDAGLADASGADDRHEPVIAQQADDILDERRSPNQAHQRNRQVGRDVCTRHRTSFQALRRRGKPIAAPRHVKNVWCTLLGFTQCLTQCSDMHAQIVFIDDRCRPHACHDIRVADDLARPLRKNDEHLERALSDRDPLTVPCQRTKRWIHLKRAKGIGCVIHVGSRGSLTRGTTGREMHCEIAPESAVRR